MTGIGLGGVSLRERKLRHAYKRDAMETGVLGMGGGEQTIVHFHTVNTQEAGGGGKEKHRGRSSIMKEEKLETKFGKGE